jgi:hypothetical protein
MILSGLTSTEIQKMIDENTYDGLDGKLALAIWRRCR